MVKVTLIHATWCHVCPSASKLWNELKEEYGFEYNEVDVDTPEGQELTTKFSIMGVPTTIIDGTVAFVGVPDRDKAIAAIS